MHNGLVFVIRLTKVTEAKKKCLKEVHCGVLGLNRVKLIIQYLHQLLLRVSYEINYRLVGIQEVKNLLPRAGNRRCDPERGAFIPFLHHSSLMIDVGPFLKQKSDVCQKAQYSVYLGLIAIRKSQEIH